MLSSISLSFLALASGVLCAGCVVNVQQVPVDPHAGDLQPISGPNYLIRSSQDQNLCLDVSGDQAKANQGVALFPCHGRENQRFAFVDKPHDSSNITAVGGLCLDVSGGGAADGTPVNVFPCGNDKPNQTFRHYHDGRIREVQTNKCLAVDFPQSGSRLVLETCNAADQGEVWVLGQ